MSSAGSRGYLPAALCTVETHPVCLLGMGIKLYVANTALWKLILVLPVAFLPVVVTVGGIGIVCTVKRRSSFVDKAKSFNSRSLLLEIWSPHPASHFPRLAELTRPSLGARDRGASAAKVKWQLSGT